METSLPTRWSIVHGAAAGDAEAARVFAETYLGIVRAYLLKRWRGRAEIVGVDDALQEVFLDFFRAGGALGRVDPQRPGGFRTFLFGVVHKVALRHEERAARERARAAATPAAEQASPERDQASRIFDRTWALELLQRAHTRLENAADGDADAQRRLEILRLRFREDLPIREIAALVGLEAVRAHREYARAREEFKAALRAEVARTVATRGEDPERECRFLLELLG
ncbi:MAG: sigma-70 family RNA polymerase sigma factor [Planctomycetes bacterium]|nr:sigma-70 family RNA polymerase sigma factor [Planctomycetota bacterium]